MEPQYGNGQPADLCMPFNRLLSQPVPYKALSFMPIRLLLAYKKPYLIKLTLADKIKKGDQIIMTL